MLELQTAYVSSLGHLQTPGEDHIPSLMRRTRISRFKCCSLTSDSEKIDFSGYLRVLLPNIKLQTGNFSFPEELQKRCAAESLKFVALYLPIMFLDL